MKAYYIDPVLEFVAEVNYSGNYKDIYKWIRAKTFDESISMATEMVYM